MANMGDINEELFEAITNKDKHKVLTVFDKYRKNPQLYSCLNIDEALNVSIPTQNLDIIKLLLSCNANIKYTDSYGKRAIHLSAESGSVDIVRCILAAGSPLNVADEDGKTPLHLAIERGYENVVEVLLDAGANINRAQTHMGEYPMHVAVKHGYVRIIDVLKARSANLNACGGNQRTPLHYAVVSKQYCTVEHLCMLGANINAQDSRGDTPLSLALSHGLMRMSYTLLNYGAKASVHTTKNRTVLHMIPSLMNKHVEVNSHSELYEKLMMSASECVNLLSDNGAPLHTAVAQSCVRAAELFLDWGAEVNLAEEKGMSALKYAATNNDISMVKLLLSRGAHVTGSLVEELSPLQDGCECNDSTRKFNVLHSLLMSQGLSARRSKVDVLKLLIGAGCPITIRDTHGFTPLDRHLFSTVPYTGRAEVVELVAAGAVLEHEMLSSGSRHSRMVLRMRVAGWRDKRTSSFLLCTWYGDLDTANFLLESSCVTCHSLRQQDWLTLPGRDDQSEAFLVHLREFTKLPETLTRLCRIEIRRRLRRLTGDKDIRERLHSLPLPKMLSKFLTLSKESEVYLGSGSSNLCSDGVSQL